MYYSLFLFFNIVAKLTGKKEEPAKEQEATTIETLEARIKVLEETNAELVQTNAEQSRIIAENTQTNAEVLAFLQTFKAEKDALAQELEEVKALTTSTHTVKLESENLAGKSPVTETKAQRTARVMAEKAKANGQL